MESLRAYIIARIAVEDRGYDTPCWIWQLSATADGYAQGLVPGRKSPGAMHRPSYEAFVGPIPDGLCIDHLCRVKTCVNPDHLEAVTSRENTLRGLSAIPHSHCRNGHEMTEDNILFSSSGRRCRTCYNEYQRTVVWPRKREEILRARRHRRAMRASGNQPFAGTVSVHSDGGTNP